MLSGARDVMRTELSDSASFSEITHWARTKALYASCDAFGFVAFARYPGISRRLLAIDAAPGDHILRLGQILGYPICCCRAARAQGENQLDSWAARPRRYLGQFRAIDPSRYHFGESLISHIPCSSKCERSLKLTECIRQAGLERFLIAGASRYLQSKTARAR